MTARRQRRRRQYNARQFKRHVLLFVGITAAVFALVVYFSFARTVVTVTPALQRVERDVTLAVGPADLEATDLAGTLRSMSVQVSSTEPVPAGADVGTPAKAGGIVRIVNNAAKNQPLVQGTRLLSESGVLFRTTASVLAPRGGSVEVEVRADTAGPAGEIGPSRFEIVALWASLKPLIYGESTIAFTGGTTRAAVVTEALAATVRSDAHRRAEEQARAALQAAVGQDDPSARTSVLAVQVTPTQERWSAQVGDTASALTFALTAQATGVVAVTETFDAVLTEKLRVGASDHTTFLDRIGSPVVAVRDVNTEQRVAVLAITQAIHTSLDGNDPLLQPRNLVNKSRREILSYFGKFEAVRATDVRFSPFWVLRAPTADHIRVVLTEPVE